MTRVEASVFRVEGSGWRNQGSWFQGSGLRVQGSAPPHNHSGLMAEIVTLDVQSDAEIDDFYLNFSFENFCKIRIDFSETI